ncbi:hypothetical protein D3C87_2110590 [compost metagenome]
MEKFQAHGVARKSGGQGRAKGYCEIRAGGLRLSQLNGRLVELVDVLHIKTGKVPLAVGGA